VSDIESRRFTAVLDAMEEHIDPEKIERTIIANAKYRIGNEPVLLRNVLPVVMAELFEKISPARLDVISIVKYYESRLAAYQARPAAHQARPAAHQARPAAHQARLAAQQARSAARQARAMRQFG
jgi:hypothetical protein